MIARLGFLLAVFLMMPLGCFAAENVTVTTGINTSNYSVMGVIIVQEVVSDGPGWIDVHKDLNETGPKIGLTHVSDGIHKNVPIFIDPKNIADSVFIQLHEDKGVEGVFEPTGPDKLVEGQLEGSCGSCWLENSWGVRGLENSWGNSWGDGVDVIAPQELVGNSWGV